MTEPDSRKNGATAESVPVKKATRKLRKLFLEPSSSIYRGVKDLSSRDWISASAGGSAFGGWIVVEPISGSIFSLVAVAASGVYLKSRGDQLKDRPVDFSPDDSALATSGRETTNIRKGLFRRFGTEASVHTEPEEFDHKHDYIFINRTDLLDYKKGDFFSIRHIKVKNVDQVPSDHIVYVENSERKCTFESTELEAFCIDSGQALAIESIERPEVKLKRHAFKIYFPEPLVKNGEFEFAYKIRLPGELEDLSEHDEVMSIYIGRIINDLKTLNFSVCLNFRPRAVSFMCRDDEGNDKDDEEADINITSFEGDDLINQEWNIDWSSTEVCKISLSVCNPKNKLYLIRYKR